MALTYTEIEQQKNRRIWIFFTIVVLFYFLIAVLLAAFTKTFFSVAFHPREASSFLSIKELFYVLLFAVLLAVVHVTYSISRVMSFVKKSLGANDIDLSDTYHKRFKNIVDEVNVATGEKYHVACLVVPTGAMNAFTVSNNNRDALIGVTEGLLSKLNRQQLQTVVAHEMGHIVSGDTYQTTIACSLFGIYAAMLNGIKHTFLRGRIRVSGRGGGAVILFLILIYLFLSLTRFFYTAIRLFVSRDRELRADAIAVRLTRDPISLSEALYLISRNRRGLGTIDPNLESLFFMNPADEEIDESEGVLADLFSTHPPIQKRMRILAQMAHADVREIQEGVIRQEKLKEKVREVPTEKSLRWMVLEREKGWSGPLDMVQMAHLGWVRPDTWIKPLREETIRQAKDEALFKPYFDRQMEGRPLSSLLCPHCRQSLVDETYEGTVVKRCLFCGGVLLEESQAMRIVIRRDIGFDERIKRLASSLQKEGLQKVQNKERTKIPFYLRCPRCGSQMARNFYTLAYLVEVDRCFSCGVVWFDKDELEVVQYLIESASPV